MMVHSAYCSVTGFVFVSGLCGVGGEMTAGIDALIRDLNEIAQLLYKYKHYGQLRAVEQIRDTLNTSRPDYERLCGIEMWGGSGAVWEVHLPESFHSEQSKSDEGVFRRAIVRIAETMNELEIGTDRSRFIAATFQSWLDKGL
jgi:hypothetical protein